MFDTSFNTSLLCDFYEFTMGNGYLKTGKKDVQACFDLYFRKVPDDGGFVVAAGLASVISYVEQLHFSPKDIEFLRSKNMFGEEFLEYLVNFDFKYTFIYDDLNTTADATIHSNCLNTYCAYNVSSVVDADSTLPNNTDATGLIRLNSEVLFFSGHGNSGSVAFSNNTYLFSNNINIADMKNTKLAVWSACYSATAPEGCTSIAQESTNAGAASAVGWYPSISSGSAKSFTDQMFNYLAANYTVSEVAVQGCNTLLWPFDPARNYHVFGDGNKKIQSSYSINIKNSTIQNTISVDQFNKDLIDFTYASYDLAGAGKRYYKIINGCLTNDFYDVITDNENNITSIKHSKNVISKDEIINLKNVELNNYPSITTSINLGNVFYDKLVKSESYNVYIKLNDELILVKIINSEYVNTQNNISYLDVKCYNLNNNELIDYNLINDIED